jgi:hypothetical protein
MSWRLRRTTQCAQCPWRKDVNPRDIPNGYDVRKHAALASTIAREGDLSGLASRELRVMACHESHRDHCLGWLMHQLGPGNNIPLRIAMMGCENAGQVRLIGEQWQTFEETLPQ